jgi:hypothetical protein
MRCPISRLCSIPSLPPSASGRTSAATGTFRYVKNSTWDCGSPDDMCSCYNVGCIPVDPHNKPYTSRGGSASGFGSDLTTPACNCSISCDRMESVFFSSRFLTCSPLWSALETCPDAIEGVCPVGSSWMATALQVTEL